MKNFYFQLSLFLFCLLMSTSLGATDALYSDIKTPVKDKTKTENLAPKDKKEGRDRNDRPKKEDVPLNTAKPKKKNVIVATPVFTTPLKQEEERTLSVDLPLLTNKNVQLLSTNLGIQKNLGPDPFAFTIITSKDSVGINEEFEVSIKINWVDFGVNTGVRFLPEWYKYTLKVLMPKGFLQTGGDYTDYCTKPVDAQNPEAIFTIKGKFEYQPSEAKFTVLRGFEGSNDLSGFVWKGEKVLNIYTKNILYAVAQKTGFKAIDSYLKNRTNQISKNSRINGLNSCSSRIVQEDMDGTVQPGPIVSPAGWENINSIDTWICGNKDAFFDITIPNSKQGGTVAGFYFAKDYYGAGNHYVEAIKSSSDFTFERLKKYYIKFEQAAHLNGNAFFRVSIGEGVVTKTFDAPVINELGNFQEVTVGPIYLFQPLTSKVTISIQDVNDVSESYLLLDDFRIYKEGVDIIPTPSNNVTITKGQSTTISATGCTNGTIFWDNGLGDGTSKAVTPQVTTIYKARCCDGSWSNGVTVTVTPPDPCQNSTLALSLATTDTDCGASNGQISATGSAGTGTLYYKLGSTGTYSSTTSTFTGLAAGSYTVYIKDDNCVKSKSASIGTKNGPNDPTDYAGGSREGEGSIDLTARCSTGSTITWYTVATGGTSVGTGSPFPTGSISTTTDYYVACRDANNCESGRKKVTATINPITNVCEGTNTPSKPSGSNNSRFGTGTVTIHASCTESVTRWYDSNNVLKQEGNLPQDDSFTTPIINAEANDVSVTYYASCLKRVGTTECESGRVGVTATVKPNNDPCTNNTPASPSKTDKQRDGAGSVTLIATCSNSKTEWYDASVGGNVKKTASDSNDNTYTPFLTETTTFYAACIGDNGCKSDRVSVTAMINIISPCASSRPAAPTTSDDNREGAGAITVKANCTTAGSVAKWFANGSGTTVLWTGSDYSTSISNTTTFYALCQNDECASNRVPATATINDISNPCAGNAPPAPSPTSGSREGTGSVNIYASCYVSPTVSNIARWYDGSGNILKTAGSSQDDSFSTPSISSTTTYYAACLGSNGCTSGKVSVAAVILPPCSTSPIPPACTESTRNGAGSITIYANCNNQPAATTGATTRWYDANNNIISNSYSLTVNIGTTTTYLAACVKGTCESSRSGVRAIIEPCNTPTPNVSGKANCGPGTFNIWASCPDMTYRGRWYDSETGGGLKADNANDNNKYTVTISSSRLYYTSCYKDGCESNRVGVWAIIIPSTIATATDRDVCEGSPINLNVTNTESFTFTGTAQPLSKTSTYQWTGPNGFVSNSQTPNIPVAALANAGNYTAKVLNQYSHFLLNNGGPLCTATTVAQVSVYPNPATAPTLTASPVCQGKEVTITATGCNAPNKVLWYNSANATTPVGNGLTFDVTVPTTATSAKYYAACTSNPQLACNSAKAEITITPIPAPTAPTNAKVNKPNTCIGSSVTLSASCPTGQTTIWYTGNTSNATSFSTLTFNLPAAGTYKYYAACKAGACETLPANRAEVSVTVNPYPSAPVSVTPSVSTICTGDAFSFGETCPTGQTLRWYSDMGGIITSIPGTYDYYLACQSNTAQCATKVEDRIKKTLVVNLATPVPVLRKQGDAATAEITSTNIYPTQPIYLTALGCEDCEVEWYEKVGGIFQLIPYENIPILSVQKSLAGTYTYKAKFKRTTCTSGFSNEFSVVVAPCPALVINQISPAYLCEGEAITLKVSTTQKGDGTTYAWFTQIPMEDNSGVLTVKLTGNKNEYYTATEGKYFVKSCLANDGKYYGESTPVEVKKLLVEATINKLNVVLAEGTALNLIGSDLKPAQSGQMLTYSWTEPVVRTTPLSTANLSIANVTPANTGFYTFKVNKTIGSKTCSSTAVADVFINAATCTIDFGNDPIYACENGKGKITVNAMNTTVGKTVYYRIDGRTWQESNEFTNLSDGVYTIELMERAASSEYGSTTPCMAVSGSRTVTIECTLPQTEGTLACGDFKIEGLTSVVAGTPITLTASGCGSSNTIYWNNGASNRASITVTPTELTTYSATCQFGNVSSGSSAIFATSGIAQYCLS
jgi:hypothetical protein